MSSHNDSLTSGILGKGQGTHFFFGSTVIEGAWPSFGPQLRPSEASDFRIPFQNVCLIHQNYEPSPELLHLKAILLPVINIELSFEL